jgi:hypothetical protein
LLRVVNIQHDLKTFAPDSLSLTAWSRVLLKKLIVTQPAKKFPAYYRISNLITLFRRDHHWSLS